jgi:hypothetical protein
MSRESLQRKFFSLLLSKCLRTDESFTLFVALLLTKNTMQRKKENNCKLVITIFRLLYLGTGVSLSVPACIKGWSWFESLYPRPHGGLDFVAVVWFGSYPLPLPPFPSASCLSFSFFVSLIELIDGMEGGGGRGMEGKGAKSYYHTTVRKPGLL